jgi:hypothetical protein
MQLWIRPSFPRDKTGNLLHRIPRSKEISAKEYVKVRGSRRTEKTDTDEKEDGGKLGIQSEHG